jgi:RIO-like serine/threonine protein kinase
MSPSTHAVLVEVVTLCRESGQPVSAATVADSLDVPESEVAGPLDSLCEFEFLEPTDRGYRQTVTGEELLALEVEIDDVVVCDVVEE